MRMFKLFMSTALCAGLLLAAPARAADFPSKDVRIVCWSAA